MKWNFADLVHKVDRVSSAHQSIATFSHHVQPIFSRFWHFRFRFENTNSISQINSINENQMSPIVLLYITNSSIAKEGKEKFKSRIELILTKIGWIRNIMKGKMNEIAKRKGLEKSAKSIRQEFITRIENFLARTWQHEILPNLSV